ncbi:MAG: zf-HC2 domain-containing protein [Planctomycetes bacterium]|nr:zf-HC2 domain-containing protein [Planctomycetota bacterium]
MNCKDLRDKLYRYFEGLLPNAEEEAIDRHAEACPECAGLLKQWSETTCRDLLDFIDDYVDGTLAESVRTVFERHLAICTQCVDYLDGYRKAIDGARALGKAERAAPPASMPPELIAAILAARKEKRS